MSEFQLVWGWQPALYLFLGGMGAGAFVAAAILFFRDRDANRKVVNISAWAAFLCLCVGLLLLVSELITPLRGLMLWQSFSNPSSWMMIGAWVVFASVIVFFAAALVTSPFAESLVSRRRAAIEQEDGIDYAADETAEGGTAGAKRLYDQGFVKVLFGLGAVLGVCVMAYTGILLMSVDGAPLWQTYLLPALFTASAFDTGLALVEIVSLAVGERGMRSKDRILLERLVIATVVIEALVLIGFVASALGGNMATAEGSASFQEMAAASAQMLITGPLSVEFWILFVGCGLVIPLIAAIGGIVMRKKESPAVMGIGAAGAIVGGCALRFLVLMAGSHVDYLADTVANLALWM